MVMRISATQVVMMKIKETMLLMIKAVLMMIVITASESTFEMYWERDFENGGHDGGDCTADGSVVVNIDNCLSVGCVTSQQRASASQGWICSDNCLSCHTGVEVADLLLLHSPARFLGFTILGEIFCICDDHFLIQPLSSHILFSWVVHAGCVFVAKCDHPLLVDLFNLYFKLCDN